MFYFKTLPVALTVILLTQQSAPTNFQSLSGRWQGNLTQLQRGACFAKGTDSRADYPYRMQLTVDSDGSFAAEPIVRPGTKDPFGTWIGKLSPSFDLTFVVPIRSTCGNGPVLTQDIRYTGRIFQKKGKYQLVVDGTAAICPQTDCVFKYTIQLQKKK